MKRKAQEAAEERKGKKKAPTRNESKTGPRPLNIKTSKVKRKRGSPTENDVLEPTFPETENAKSNFARDFSDSSDQEHITLKQWKEDQMSAKKPKKEKKALEAVNLIVENTLMENTVPKPHDKFDAERAKNNFSRDSDSSTEHITLKQYKEDRARNAAKKLKKTVEAVNLIVENPEPKHGVLKKTKPGKNGKVSETTNPLQIKKKVRIDETESLKYKREIAESEHHHFSKKELPAKIIKSKLNKNLTEEVKVNKTKGKAPQSNGIQEPTEIHPHTTIKREIIEDDEDGIFIEQPNFKSRNSLFAEIFPSSSSCPKETEKSRKDKWQRMHLTSSNSFDSDKSKSESLRVHTSFDSDKSKSESLRVHTSVDSDKSKSESLRVHTSFDTEDTSGESDLESFYNNKKAEKEATLKLKQSEPKKTGVQVLMPKEDQLILVERLQEFIPEGDTKSYTYRLQNIDWAKVTFSNYSLEECQKVWGLLLKKVRHYRLLSEITGDVKHIIKNVDMQPLTKKSKKSKEKHPDMPKRPMSSYFLYYMRHRDRVRKEFPHLDTVEVNKHISTIFQCLPAEKKNKYEAIAAKNREEYKVQMEQFYYTHPEFRKVTIKKERKDGKEKPPQKPDNPYRLFVQSELEREEISEEDKGEFKEVCREKWRQMPDSKKVDWILQAEQQLRQYEEELKDYMARHPDFTPKTRKPFLSRHELDLKEKVAGKPKKPPTSAYSLFVSLTIQSNDAQEIPSRERWAYTSAKWKAMTEQEKDQFKVLLGQLTEQYQKEFKVYLDSLPEDKRQEEILKNLPKKKRQRSKSTATAASGPSASTSEDRDRPSTSRGHRAKSANKSARKGSKNKDKIPYPVTPPRSAYKYFSEQHKGPDAKEAWKNLSSAEKRKFNDELDAYKDKYIKDFESYLKSLDRDELSVFCASRNTQEEDFSTSDPSESESEDEPQSSSEEEEEDSSSEED